MTWTDAVTATVRIGAPARDGRGWSRLGPPVRTLRMPEFESACGKLMRLVEIDYAPTLIVGIPTGGLVVAQVMARAAAMPPPILPLTCRRANTDAKSRLKLVRSLLSTLPRPTADLFRRVEHRLVAVPRARRLRPQEIDHAEAEAIGAWVANRSPAKLLVADDAVDSGGTLITVLRQLQAVCPAGTEIRSAVITQTLEQPIARPDYVLYRGLLCRFPWSFDAS